jgi:hypothetical protein
MCVWVLKSILGMVMVLVVVMGWMDDGGDGRSGARAKTDEAVGLV